MAFFTNIYPEEPGTVFEGNRIRLARGHGQFTDVGQSVNLQQAGSWD